MIEQQGKVIAILDGVARVRIGGNSGCATCDAGRGCGAGIFGRLLRRRPLILELPNSVGAGQGQAVMVGVPETLFITLIARMYLFPLLAGLVGAAVGHYISVLGTVSRPGGDLLSLICAGGFGAAALAWNRNKAREFNGNNIVHLLRVAKFPASETE